MPFIWETNRATETAHSFRQLVSQKPETRDGEFNQWFLFRKQFHCEQCLSSAITQITVDGRYQLFINQQRVSRGPVRCDPEFLRYDEIDISNQIQKGLNTIGVLVHVYGKDLAWYQKSKDFRQGMFGDGGLFFNCKLQPENTNQKSTTIESDESWRCLKLSAWQQDTPQSGWGQGFIEKFNAEDFPEQWLEDDFDDCSWSEARVLVYVTSENEKKMGWGDISPFPILVKNTLKPLTEKNVFPKNIVSIFQVTPDQSLSFEERLYQEDFSLLNESEAVINNLENMLQDNDKVTSIKRLDQKDICIVVEFDKLYTGYPFIEILAHGGELIEVAVSEKLPGEYIDCGIEEKRIRIGSHLDCKHIFSYTAKQGLQKFEKFEWTAVKYLQIIVRNISKKLEIKNLGVNSTHYPLKSEGAFESSDHFLNKLWDMGRYTTLLCSHDAWEDCPSREKRQWIGDGLIHYPVAHVCFGNSGIELDKLYLQQASESQRTDGLLQMFAPGDHHYHGIVIPDFSLHWVSTLYHYLWNTNDIETAIELFPTLQKILNWFYLQLNEDGMLEDMPHWHFIEWANMGRSGQSSTINALFSGTLKHAAFIAKQIGFDAATLKMKNHLDTIVANLNQNFWDSDKGVYTDWAVLSENDNAQQVSQHVNSLMIYYELAPRSRWRSMLNYICDLKRVKLTATPPVVMTGEAFNLSTDVVKCNTYYSHFLYGALAKAKRFSQALDIIKSSYTPMLSTNTSTLWESFAPDASLCHAFSASPVYYLSKEILGIEIVNPGFSKIRISPQLSNLKFAKGSYPTNKGNIEVSWMVENHLLKIELVIPKGIEADLLATENAVIQQSFKLQTGFQSIEIKLNEESTHVEE